MLEKKGHKVYITTRDKDITHHLLDDFKIPYRPISKQKTFFLGLIFELLIRWLKIFYLIISQRIDLSVSIAGIFTSFPSKLLGIPTITITDTEDATLSNKIAFKFSDVILTPEAYLKKNDAKQIRTYPGYHELSYLHPNQFHPNQESLVHFGVNNNEPYVVIRLVQWKALHDINESGINEDDLQKMMDFFNKQNVQVLISSERELAPAFDQYLIKANYSKIHDLLAFSRGYIGESPTMAMEAAILQKPSIFISSRINKLGYTKEMAEKYRLIFNYQNFHQANSFIEKEFLSQELENALKVRLNKLLNDTIDVATWMADCFETTASK